MRKLKKKEKSIDPSLNSGLEKKRSKTQVFDNSIHDPKYESESAKSALSFSERLWDKFSFTQKKPNKNTTKRIRQKRGLLLVRSWFLIFIFLSSALALSIAIFIGLPEKLYVQSRTYFIKKSAECGFDLRDVLVEGRKHTPLSEVLNAVNAHTKNPILEYDIDLIRDKLLKIDWIKNVTIERRLPHVLYIRVQERVPIAIWQRDKKHYLVDSEGVVINGSLHSIFKDLPIVGGGDAPAHAPKIVELLNKFPSIKQRTSALVRVRNRRWDLTLEGSVIVQLPEEDMENAMIRLLTLIENDKLSSKNILSVDLRIPGKVIIKITEDSFESLKKKKKEEKNNKKNISL